MTDIYAHHSRIDVGAVWIRNAEQWLSSPRCATMSSTERGETMTNTYEGRRVETEWGPGTIRTLTGRSVVIDLDGQPSPISIVRGSYGWDRWIDANREALS